MTTVFQDLMTGLDEIDAFLSGHAKGFRVTLPQEVDVKGIRKKLSMTQARFSDTFGFSLDAVKHWEGGRRTPEASARAFLTVIERNPAAVISALHHPAKSTTIPIRQKRNISAKMNKRAHNTSNKSRTARAS